MHHRGERREDLGGEEPVQPGEKPAGEARDDCADRDGARLCGANLDPEGGGGAFAALQRRPGEAVRGAAQGAEAELHDEQHDPAQHEEAARVVERGFWIHGGARADTGETPLPQHQVEGGGEAERDDRELDAANPHGRDADHHTHHARDEAADEHEQQEREVRPGERHP